MRHQYFIVKFALSCLFLFYNLSAMAQTVNGCKPPINRVRWHELIDREQKIILNVVGKVDNEFRGTGNEEINHLVTLSVIQKVDDLQCKIELDTAINHQRKVNYLSGLEKVLKAFLTQYRSRHLDASNLPLLIEVYGTAIQNDKHGALIDSLISKSSYEVGNIIISSNAFTNNPGFYTSKGILLLKYSSLHPERILYSLSKDSHVPFLDSLIRIAAYKYPNQLYDYAVANNKLGYAIRKVNDSLVKTISKIAKTRGSGQFYLPFLDKIMHEQLSFEEIDAVKNNDINYFKLLVKTRLDYLKSLSNNEQIYGMKALEERLSSKVLDYFIKKINALHEEPDLIRFQVLNELTAQELYYVTVFSESEIYTTSYTNGVYPYLMKKIGGRADSLLVSVRFDKFKKFIKLAAGFNTLNDFLKSFQDHKDAETLMAAFVNGLEKSKSLEEGVDVADSYASILENSKPLADRMLQNIKSNYETNLAQKNTQGTIVYNLLYKLFLSADSSQKVDLSKEFDIPPVYKVSYNSLTNDSGRQVVMQVFFYGDKDGRNAYHGFLRQFSSSGWKRSETKQWVTYVSTKGKPVLIFANKPLSEDTGEDEKAQKALGAYLQQQGLKPTIVIHRGHSYYAPYTIKQIQPSAKIVFLGSCGGYHQIHEILQNAPEAHIIASKQIGKQVINQPFFDVLNERLLKGRSIDWLSFWSDFKRKAGSVEGFEDYIPPHRNLGAIFLKAYKNQMDY